MKKILLFSVVLVLAGISATAQEKTSLKKTKSAAVINQVGNTIEASDLDKRIAEKQLEVQRKKAAGSDTRFSKASASEAVSTKKD